ACGFLGMSESYRQVSAPSPTCARAARNRQQSPNTRATPTEHVLGQTAIRVFSTRLTRKGDIMTTSAIALLVLALIAIIAITIYWPNPLERDCSFDDPATEGTFRESHSPRSDGI